MEYVVVIGLVSLSILFIGWHFRKIATGKSGCDCCDHKSSCCDLGESCKDKESDDEQNSSLK